LKATLVVIALLQSIAPSLAANAPSPVGAYYLPGKKLSDSVVLFDTLRMFRPDGTYQSEIVGDGGREEVTGRWSVDGDHLTMNGFQIVHKCRFTRIDYYSHPEDFSFTFERTETALLLHRGNDTMLYPAATQAEVDKILATPLCSD
jgi:hypothetical protein